MINNEEFRRAATCLSWSSDLATISNVAIEK